MNKIDVVLGLQYGDEGKGKITNQMAKSGDYDYVMRYNGGSNAGQVRVYGGVAPTNNTTTTTAIAPATTTVAPATTIVSPSVLPETGSQSDRWMIVGMFTLIIGTVLVTRRRDPR